MIDDIDEIFDVIQRYDEGMRQKIICSKCNQEKLQYNSIVLPRWSVEPTSSTNELAMICSDCYTNILNELYSKITNIKRDCREESE